MTMNDSAKLLREISIINNRGAFLIEIGRFDEAAIALVKALELSKETETLEQTNNHSAKQCSVDDCIKKHPSLTKSNSKTSSTSTAADATTADATKDTDPNTCSDSNSDATYVYTHPIHIPKKAQRSVVTISAINIYNLALAHHRNALESQIEVQHRLQTALHLYELAYQLCADDQSCCGPRFTLILLNNIGQIHLQLQNKKYAHLCFQQLLSTMMFMVDCGSDCTQDLDGFIQNATRIIMNNVTAPAA